MSYCKASIVVLYSVGLVSESPKNIESFASEVQGVGAGFALAILCDARGQLHICLDWDGSLMMYVELECPKNNIEDQGLW